LDLNVQMESGVRAQLSDALALFDSDRLQNFDVLARLRQLANTDLIDCLNKRRSTAVHDRHFFAVDLDIAVVDRQTTERGEKMLDCSDGYSGVVTDDGAEGQVFDVINLCGYFRNNSATFIY